MKGKPKPYIFSNLKFNISRNAKNIEEKNAKKINKIAHISVHDNCKSNFNIFRMYNFSGTLSIGPDFWVRHFKKLAAKFQILPGKNIGFGYVYVGGHNWLKTGSNMGVDAPWAPVGSKVLSRVLVCLATAISKTSITKKSGWAPPTPPPPPPPPPPCLEHFHEYIASHYIIASMVNPCSRWTGDAKQSRKNLIANGKRKSQPVV